MGTLLIIGHRHRRDIFRRDEVQADLDALVGCPQGGVDTLGRGAECRTRLSALGVELNRNLLGGEHRRDLILRATDQRQGRNGHE